jgi:hypothetical protein
MEFIFMLTHHDVTIPNALQVLEEIKDSGIRHIGCKDIGLNLDQYKQLFARMKASRMQTYLEVVTYDEKEHFRGVDLALTVGADNLIGGMPSYTKRTVDYLKSKGRGTRFFPYIGNVSGHPCILGGDIPQMIKSGKESQSLGIDGINLLLYRYTGDQKMLLKAAVKELEVPLIVAGNVATFEQIEELKNNDVWAFTIGGAVFERKFVPSAPAKHQIKAILKKL